MKLIKKNAEIYVPDSIPAEEAFRRTTCMSIAAHPDDLEIMAYQGIAQCFGKNDKWFTGVVVTDGAGSSGSGPYGGYTDGEMACLRKREQRKAAFAGEYGAAVLLGYSSLEAREPANAEMVAELSGLIALAMPEIIYTHNLADKHDTHIAVAIKVIRAIRQLRADMRPQRLYGCEVWRSLDWVNDEEKAVFDVSEHPNIAAAVLGVHDSQIGGGKRYDLATEGRRRANATFRDTRAADRAEAVSYAMDLTPLIVNDQLDINGYVQGYIRRFGEDVGNRLKRLQGQ